MSKLLPLRAGDPRSSRRSGFPDVEKEDCSKPAFEKLQKLATGPVYRDTVAAALASGPLYSKKTFLLYSNADFFSEWWKNQKAPPSLAPSVKTQKK